MLERLVQFLFILAVPLLIVAGTLVALFATGALFDALDHPETLRLRLAGLFRSKPPAGRPVGSGHYYKPYWKR